MNRRTKAILLIAGLAVTTALVSGVMLVDAFARSFDRGHGCETGFSRLVDCYYGQTSTSSGQGKPLFAAPGNSADTAPPNPLRPFQPTSIDVTSWAVADCPANAIARRLFCDASTISPAHDDATTGLPRPKPWLVTTAKESSFIKAVHLETPLDLPAVLGFYRAELRKRGWTENDGAAVAGDGAKVAFTTPDGPALLRLARQDDRTIVDLSLRKPAAIHASMRPKPGHVRLVLGNTRDEAAVITINDQTIALSAQAGRALTGNSATGHKSPHSPDIDLPPGKYNVILKLASGTAQSRQFEIAADETWGLLAGPAGVALPVRLY